jgi:Xaa-Pro dipeptidase
LTVIEQNLIEAQQKAQKLFQQIKESQIIRPGISELEVSNEIYELAESLFGIKKYWHKRIVRSGKNTLFPYRENPRDLLIQDDDIVFFDFGPIFDNFEADIGRTFVLGDDPDKHHLAQCLQPVFDICKNIYLSCPAMTGAELYNVVETKIQETGWQISSQEHCGHLVGSFPHEKILGDTKENYICPENHLPMNFPDKFGKPRNWILEIHLISSAGQFGGFYEDLLNLTVSQ